MWPGTRRRSIAAIRSFFAFLVNEGIITRSPAADLLPSERETHPPRVLTEEEYTRLRGAAADHFCDSALIELALQTGLRLTEIAHLHVADVADVALPPHPSRLLSDTFVSSVAEAMDAR